VVQRAKPVFGKKELSEAEQRSKSMDEMFEKAKRDADDDGAYAKGYVCLLYVTPNTNISFLLLFFALTLC
jgi:hypothetical protein